MTDIKHLETDQQWSESQTVYWYEVSNCPYLTETTVVGLAIFVGGTMLLMDDGEPMPPCQARDFLESRLKELTC